MSETTGRCRSEVDSYRKPEFHYAAIADAIDRLAADVAAVKAKVGAVSPDDVRHFVESEKAWVTPPWQRAKWDEALAIICNGGDWGRGNNFDHGVLGALVIWADKEMDRLTAERDAAIRERDEARALLELAQVQRNVAYADRDEAWSEVYRLKCSMTETSKERDAAIRERDEARAEVERLRGELAARPAAAPAAGWLTDIERRAVAYFADVCRDDLVPDEWTVNAGVLRSLFSRAGSPPVVEVPAMPLEVGDANTHTGQYLRGRRDIAVSYRAALDKAGVAWKEVPRE